MTTEDDMTRLMGQIISSVDRLTDAVDRVASDRHRLTVRANINLSLIGLVAAVAIFHLLYSAGVFR